MVALMLEIIGNDSPGNVRLWKRLLRDNRRARRMIYPEPWVARLRVVGERLAFEFLRGEKDYSQANATGSRGIFCTFWLEDEETYQVCEFTGYLQERRYHCRIEQGRLVRLIEKEARAWLSDRSASTY